MASKAISAEKGPSINSQQSLWQPIHLYFQNAIWQRRGCRLQRALSVVQHRDPLGALQGDKFKLCEHTSQLELKYKNCLVIAIETTERESVRLCCVRAQSSALANFYAPF